MNKWKELYNARASLVEKSTELLKGINSDTLNAATSYLVDRIYQIPKIADIDFEFFQKSIDEYGINELDSLALLLNYNELTLTWLLQNKDHYNKWKDVNAHFIWEFLELGTNEQQIAESYLRSKIYAIEYIHSAKRVIDAYIGDFTIAQFVQDNMGELFKYLVGNFPLSVDYETCLRAIISDHQYVVIRLDENNIRVFKY